MSHFATLKTKMISRNALVAALKAMGYTVEVHDQAVELNTRYDYHENNRGLMANVIIRRETINLYTDQEIAKTITGEYAKYYQKNPGAVAELRAARVGADVGFALQDDGTYAITADSFYRTHQSIQDSMPHQYAKQVILNQAESLGHDYAVTERQDDQGRFLGWQIEVQPDEIEYMGVSSTFNSASLLSQY